MSLTLATWLVAFAALVLLALTRGARWGLALYALTFFAHPPEWWWGKPIAGYRWNFSAALIFLVALLLERTRHRPPFAPEFEPPRVPGVRVPPVERMAVLIALNASFVHWFLAGGADWSFDAYMLLVKFMVLFFLVVHAIRGENDLWFAVLVLVVGMAYIGYEATVNDRGVFSGGRLEDIGAPGAATANFLASLGVTILPLAGMLILVGPRVYRWVAVVCAPFIFNVVLLCNSRGAFLAGLFALVVMVVGAKGRQKKYALAGVVLAGAATLVLLKDPQIIHRFATVFVRSPEQLDTSASNRLLFWKAGLRMIGERPLGAGGDAFAERYGQGYLEELGVYRARAVHNGYLNEACQWGVQGLALRLAFIFAGVLGALRARRYYHDVVGDPRMGFVGTCLISSMAALMVSAMFSNTLDKEWGVWIVALMTAYARVVPQEAPAAAPEDAEPARPPIPRHVL